MASIQKNTTNSVEKKMLQHNYRLIDQPTNTDIDHTKTHLNYSLTPHHDNLSHANKEDRAAMAAQEKAYYNQRLSECYHLDRADIKTWAGCIVTAPKEIANDKDKQDQFFRAVADFLMDRYGEKNTISITVHYDEMRQKQIINTDGEQIAEFTLGEPHLHFCWIPVVAIDHEALRQKKRPVKAMFDYAEKVSAKEFLTKKELQTLHPDLQRYLDEHLDFRCPVISGVTAAQGGNRTVKELKKATTRDLTILQEYIKDLEKENKQLKEKINELERTKEKELTWGQSTTWGDIGWNKDKEITR